MHSISKKTVHSISIFLLIICLFACVLIFTAIYTPISDYHGTIIGFRWTRAVDIQEQTGTDTWKTIDTAISSSEDKNPYWNEPDLTENQRYGDRTESYSIIVKDDNNNLLEHHIGYDQWLNLNINDPIVTQRRP